MEAAALTHHGGRVDAAMARWPDAPRPWLDLSTGINPQAWTPRKPLAIDLSRLPSPDDLAALEAAAARHFGVAAHNVAAVPGSEMALRLIGRIGLPGPHAHVSPGYRTHGIAFAGSTGVALPAAPVDAGTLLLANPGNPTGRLLEADRLRALAGRGWLIVDEAFADCTPDASIAPVLPARTIVLRSFGKFFGLAGLRLGFVIAADDVLAHLREMLGDWPIAAPAIAHGTAAYRDTEWIVATRARLAEQAAALDAMLAHHGYRATGQCPLFRLIEASPALFEQLARSGILTRPFDHDPGLLRIGLPPDDAAFDRLDRALGRG